MKNILTIRVCKKFLNQNFWCVQYTFDDYSTTEFFIDEVLTLEQAVVESIHRSELELLPEMFATSSDWGGWAIWESGPPDLIYI